MINKDITNEFLSWEEISNFFYDSYNYYVYVSSGFVFNSSDDDYKAYKLLEESSGFIIIMGDYRYFGLISSRYSRVIKLNMHLTIKNIEITDISFHPVCNIPYSELNKVNLKKCRNIFIEDQCGYVHTPTIKVIPRDYYVSHVDCQNAIISGSVFELDITKILTIIRESYLSFILSHYTTVTLTPF